MPTCHPRDLHCTLSFVLSSVLYPVLCTVLCTVPCPLYKIHTYQMHTIATSGTISRHPKCCYCIDIQRLNMSRMCTGLHGWYMVYGIVSYNVIYETLYIYGISLQRHPFLGLYYKSIISFATPCAPSARLSDRRYL